MITENNSCLTNKGWINGWINDLQTTMKWPCEDQMVVADRSIEYWLCSAVLCIQDDEEE